jgi:CubicO group peptidase (beta-lactamase class C family)
MARIGLLALRGGRWGDRQLVPTSWIARTTTLVSPLTDMDAAFEDSPPTVGRWGYGYLWWVWDARDPSDPLAGAFTAWGINGQYISIVPKLDMVVAHKTDPANRRSVSARQYDIVLRMLIAAALQPTRQRQDDQDEQDQPEAAARIVAPASAMRPRRQRTNQHQYEQHNQHSHHSSAPWLI